MSDTINSLLNLIITNGGFTVAGLIVGFAVGATGVGGGALMTPILYFIFGLPAAVAVGTDLIYATVTKTFGVYLHGNQGTVDWKVVRRMALGSLPACVVTVLILRFMLDSGEVADDFIVGALSIAILATAILTLFRRRLRRLSRYEGFQVFRVIHQQGKAPLTIAAGVVIGSLVALSSVGAGVIGAVVLFSIYPRMPAIAIVGTDLAHAVLLTGTASLLHFAVLDTINFSILGWLLLGSLPGIYLGTRLGFRLPDETLRPIIAGVLLVIGCGLAVEVLLK